MFPMAWSSGFDGLALLTLWERGDASIPQVFAKTIGFRFEALLLLRWLFGACDRGGNVEEVSASSDWNLCDVVREDEKIFRRGESESGAQEATFGH